LWRRRVLDLLAQEEEGKLQLSSESSNKVLPRLAIVYGILRRLGFQQAASIQCLQSVQHLDVDKALDWVCTVSLFALVRVLRSC
jgi:ATP-dependent RNA helicase DHX29